MRGLLIVCALLAATCAGAAAQTGVPVDRDWDPAARDFGRGGGDGASSLAPPPGVQGSVGSITGIDRELARRDLPAKDRAWLLLFRGFLNAATGNRAQADRDYQQALRTDPQLKFDLLAARALDMARSGATQPAVDLVERALSAQPGYPALLRARAEIRMMQGEYARALPDLDQTAPGSDAARRLRAQAHFGAGNHAAALDDLDHLLRSGAQATAPIHLALWRYANNVKLRRDARGQLAADLRTHGEPARWPAPVARYLSGRMTLGELELAAESDADARRTGGRCLASFFIAMETLRQGNRARAGEQMRLAQARCPAGSLVNWAATAELRRL
ncbi:MAG: hypothetical protein IPK81_13210 [Rhodospirillales bacterium]|nr:MAG: hypothetical protein IPK81_13210 [Rhodospirillales bacterium]